jgi:hypothetical protein
VNKKNSTGIIDPRSVHWFSEIVTSHAHNETMNMTRKERTQKESGVMHWTKTVYKGNVDDGSVFRGSCFDYLKMLEREESKNA